MKNRLIKLIIQYIKKSLIGNNQNNDNSNVKISPNGSTVYVKNKELSRIKAQEIAKKSYF